MKRILSILSAAVLLTACSSDEPGNGAAPEIEMSRAQEEALQTQNDFSFRMLGSVMKTTVDDAEEPNKDVILSPLSLSMDLCMAASGASDEAAGELYDALGFDGMTAQDVAEANRTIMRMLPSLDRQTKVNLANSVWVDTYSNIFKTFTNQCQQQFGADVFTMELGTTDCMNRINAWVDKKTYGFISTLLKEPFNETTYLSFINAVYFKGSWTEKFDRTLTKTEEFSNYDGSKGTVAMMHNTDTYAYREGNGARAVTLEYGNGAFAMTLVLPDEGTDIMEYVSTFTADKFNGMEIGKSAQGASLDVVLGLPRFSAYKDSFLKGNLSSLGISKIFSTEALSRIADTPKELGSIRQIARIEVDEEGTTAAAVTATGQTTAGIHETVKITFNRPFFYWISERSTGAILFTGAVMNPAFER